MIYMTHEVVRRHARSLISQSVGETPSFSSSEIMYVLRTLVIVAVVEHEEFQVYGETIIKAPLLHCPRLHIPERLVPVVRAGVEVVAEEYREVVAVEVEVDDEGVLGAVDAVPRMTATSFRRTAVVLSRNHRTRGTGQVPGDRLSFVCWGSSLRLRVVVVLVDHRASAYSVKRFRQCVVELDRLPLDLPLFRRPEDGGRYLDAGMDGEPVVGDVGDGGEVGDEVMTEVPGRWDGPGPARRRRKGSLRLVGFARKERMGSVVDPASCHVARHPTPCEVVSENALRWRGLSDLLEVRRCLLALSIVFVRE